MQLQMICNKRKIKIEKPERGSPSGLVRERERPIDIDKYKFY